jgi:hypothetical protein
MTILFEKIHPTSVPDSKGRSVLAAGKCGIRWMNYYNVGLNQYQFYAPDRCFAAFHTGQVRNTLGCNNKKEKRIVWHS